VDRRDYRVFSPGAIGPLTVPSRWVRSATADLGPWKLKRFTEEDFALYRELVESGIGLIIVTGSEVLPETACEKDSLSDWTYSYAEVRIDGTAELLGTMREAAPDCVILAQLECNAILSGDRPAAPSPVRSPYYEGRFRELAVDEIERIIDAFVEAIVRMKEEGFDGVQLHAAHGGGLWLFLSPAGNQRTDDYGGTAEKRVRIVSEIVRRARKAVGEFPILIKANCTDDLEGGIDRDNFPKLACALESAGIDAIEVSGGTWDALVRSEEELGFRPIPAAESHTGILDPEKQNYFLPYVDGLDLGIPIILVGGVRNVERAEEIVRNGAAEFVAMCRPLIREPNLVARWRDGLGSAEAECIACNSCIHSMHVPFERLGRKIVTCLPLHNRTLHAEAQQWLTTFVDNIRAGS
jgi:2,4-dienoyl-CoA reductase-like NADH-dependent reductase (Old Yellow Enzyme family)